MTTISDTVTFCFDDDQVKISIHDANEYLYQFDSFSVFVTFIHPVTGILIEQHAICYPNPQNFRDDLFGFGECFLSEVSGVIIKLPAGITWYASDVIEKRQIVPKVTFLHRGEIQTIFMGIEFTTAFSIPGDLRASQNTSS